LFGDSGAERQQVRGGAWLPPSNNSGKNSGNTDYKGNPVGPNSKGGNPAATQKGMLSQKENESTGGHVRKDSLNGNILQPGQPSQGALLAMHGAGKGGGAKGAGKGGMGNTNNMGNNMGNNAQNTNNQNGKNTNNQNGTHDLTSIFAAFNYKGNSNDSSNNNSNNLQRTSNNNSNNNTNLQNLQGKGNNSNNNTSNNNSNPPGNNNGILGPSGKQQQMNLISGVGKNTQSINFQGGGSAQAKSSGVKFDPKANPKAGGAGGLAGGLAGGGFPRFNLPGMAGPGSVQGGLSLFGRIKISVLNWD
jgi:hypothetical protein